MLAHGGQELFDMNGNRVTATQQHQKVLSSFPPEQFHEPSVNPNHCSHYSTGQTTSHKVNSINMPVTGFISSYQNSQLHDFNGCFIDQMYGQYGQLPPQHKVQPPFSQPKPTQHFTSLCDSEISVDPNTLHPSLQNSSALNAEPPFYPKLNLQNKAYWMLAPGSNNIGDPAAPPHSPVYKLPVHSSGVPGSIDGGFRTFRDRDISENAPVGQNFEKGACTESWNSNDKEAATQSTSHQHADYEEAKYNTYGCCGTCGKDMYPQSADTVCTPPTPFVDLASVLTPSDGKRSSAQELMVEVKFLKERVEKLEVIATKRFTTDVSHGDTKLSVDISVMNINDFDKKILEEGIRQAVRKALIPTTQIHNVQPKESDWKPTEPKVVGAWVEDDTQRSGKTTAAARDGWNNDFETLAPESSDSPYNVRTQSDNHQWNHSVICPSNHGTHDKSYESKDGAKNLHGSSWCTKPEVETQPASSWDTKPPIPAKTAATKFEEAVEMNATEWGSSNFAGWKNENGGPSQEWGTAGVDYGTGWDLNSQPDVQTGIQGEWESSVSEPAQAEAGYSWAVWTDPDNNWDVSASTVNKLDGAEQGNGWEIPVRSKNKSASVEQGTGWDVRDGKTSDGNGWKRVTHQKFRPFKANGRGRSRGAERTLDTWRRNTMLDDEF